MREGFCALRHIRIVSRQVDSELQRHGTALGCRGSWNGSSVNLSSLPSRRLAARRAFAEPAFRSVNTGVKVLSTPE